MTEEDALKVAQGFISHRSMELSPEWAGSTAYSANKLFSSDGELVAYDVPVTSASGMEKGSVVVNPATGGNVILSFSTTGESFNTSLDNYYQTELSEFFLKNGLVVSEVKYLFQEPMFAAVGVKFLNDSPALSGMEQQDGYYIFSPFSGVSQYSFNSNGSIAEATAGAASARATSSAGAVPDSGQSEDEAKAFRDALINQDFSGEWFAPVTDVSMLPVAGQVGTAARTVTLPNGTFINDLELRNFAPYNQERRFWNGENFQCAAGCTPVGWAVIYSYWEAKGYHRLIGDLNRVDLLSSETSQPVRDMLARSRSLMKTNCTTKDGKGAGNTDIFNAPNGVKYAHERGYTKWTTGSCNYYNPLCSVFNTTKSEIDNGRPTLSAIKVKTSTGSIEDHTAVGFAYEEAPGNQNDFVVVHLGWGKDSSGTRWQKIPPGDRLRTVITVRPSL